ncbi:unnamed protein product [Somion occarium]|uniref:F-box domain-containing protein n=1 Tax=Somion occarium TaxID=3059160 RepID=A0ABP1EBH5_9APHY
MDSEDERELEQDNELRGSMYTSTVFMRYLALNARHLSLDSYQLEMRLHQSKERECLRRLNLLIYEGSDSDKDENEDDDDDSDEDYGDDDDDSDEDQDQDEYRRIVNTARIYRIMRFYQTVEGFHKGSLDLTGRHRPRYDSIIRRWNAFSSDLEDVLSNAKLSFTPMNIGDSQLGGKAALEPKLEPESPHKWDQFLVKWHAHDTFSLYKFSTWRDRVVDCFRENRNPKFQTLCLHHLPPELLLYIVEIAGVDLAQKLGTTCRLLRDISFPYVFKDHTFNLSCNLDRDHQYNSLDSFDAQVAYLEPLVAQARLKFLSDVDFVKARPDILTALRNLSVHGDWRVQTNLVDDESRHSFYAPVYASINNLLPCLPNLQSLTLTSWDITEELTRSFRCLKQLHTLMMSACTSAVRFPHAIAKLPSLLNLQLLMFTKEQRDCWLFLGMCPNIKDLFVLSSGGNRLGDDPDLIMPLLPFELATAFNPFNTLQRLSVLRVPQEWLLQLNASIQSVRDGHKSTGLQLTHFKLEISDGLDRQNLFTLLDALNGASIRFLVLDGLRYAAPDLLDRIASAMPQLEYLSLHYKESDTVPRTIAASWPFATSEYAPHFANFTLLRWFFWNHRTNIDKSESIAKLFSASCPSLEGVDLKPSLGGTHKKVHAKGEIAFVTNDVSTDTILCQMCHPLQQAWPPCTPASI